MVVLASQMHAAAAVVCQEVLHIECEFGSDLSVLRSPGGNDASSMLFGFPLAC